MSSQIQSINQAPATNITQNFDTGLITDTLGGLLQRVDRELIQRIKVSSIELQQGQKICKLKVDFSYYPLINGTVKDTNTDKVIELLKTIDACAPKLKKLGIDRLVIDDLNLSHNNVSGYCVVGITICETGITKSLTKLDLSYTKATSRVLGNIDKLPLLKELRLDGCEEMQTIPGTNILNNTLESISLVKTKAIVNNEYLDKLETGFPSIKNIYVTQPQGTKFLGIKDSTTMVSAVDPVVLNPCGHVLGKTSAQFDIQRRSCSLCRTRPDQNTPSFPAQFPISVIKKENNRWIVELRDFGRNKAEGHVYFHPNCQQIFSEETLKRKFALYPTNSQQAQTQLKTLICPGCKENGQDGKALETIEIHPNLTPDDPFEDSVQQTNLHNLSKYCSTDQHQQ